MSVSRRSNPHEAHKQQWDIHVATFQEAGSFFDALIVQLNWESMNGKGWNSRAVDVATLCALRTCFKLSCFVVDIAAFFVGHEYDLYVLSLKLMYLIQEVTTVIPFGLTGDCICYELCGIVRAYLII